MYPGISPRLEASERIHEISPTYVIIYNESLAAEHMGIKHIAGMGYRKALEFLLNDYLRFKHRNDTQVLDAIEETPQLGILINNFVTDPQVRFLATRAAWLGNDQVHYTREWGDKGINDLKKMIQEITYWIERELFIPEVEQEMPRRPERRRRSAQA